MSFKIILGIALTILILSSANAQSASKYLDSSYLKRSSKITHEQKSSAKKLADEGVTLNKQKRFVEAIAEFEASLEIMPAADTYYQYGNSLLNAGRYDDAIKAYGLALTLEYDKDYYCYYNMACSFSRLNDELKSISFIEKAILHGYPHLKHISSDPDLEYIRSLKNWQSSLKDITDLFNRGYGDFISGKKVTGSYASSEDEYYFYPDKTVKIKYLVSEDRNHIKTGYWSANNYSITIKLDTEYGEEGVGKAFHCGATCEYESYKKYNRTIAESETITWKEIFDTPDGQWAVEEISN